MPTTQSPFDPIKHELYGRYQMGEDRQQQFEKQKQELYMKGAHKALDIPQTGEDMNITTNTKNGMGARELALAVGGTLLALLIGKEFYKPLPQPVPTPVIQPTEKPLTGNFQTKEYNLKFVEPSGDW